MQSSGSLYLHLNLSHSLLRVYNHVPPRSGDTLPGMDALDVKTSLSSSGQLMFSMSLGDCCQVEGDCVEGVEPQNTAAEALLLVRLR